MLRKVARRFNLAWPCLEFGLCPKSNRKKSEGLKIRIMPSELHFENN